MSSDMNLRSRLDALQKGEAPSSDASHARKDAVLRALAAEDIEVLRDVLDRWERAGHPAGSIPNSSDLEPTDTGMVVDPDTQTLIAHPQEWEVFQRVIEQLD